MKLKKSVLGLAVLAGAVMGCKFSTTENTKVEKDNCSSMSKTYYSIITLQRNCAIRGVEAVSQYVDLPQKFTMARSTHVDIVNSLAEIEKALPDNAASLTRARIKKNESYARSVDAEIMETVTLEQELAEIEADFSNTLETLLPDPTPALSLPFVDTSDDGMIIGGDTVIPYKSIEGAMAVEILNAYARGEDINVLLKNFENDIGTIVGMDADARAIAKTGDAKWTNGIIYYCWGTISDAHKTATLVAMNDWTSKTENIIKFEELAINSWINFLLRLHLRGAILIEDKPDSEMNGYAGYAHIGYGGGYRIFYLNEELYTQSDLTRVPRHELGHTLGLYHEHQRYNRNDYIIVPEGDSNYSIIPKTILGIGVKWMSMRILWWTIWIPYPALVEKENSITSAVFDFKSIMLYAGMEVKPEKRHLNDDFGYTRNNTEISSHDIEMVKRLYK